LDGCFSLLAGASTACLNEVIYPLLYGQSSAANGKAGKLQLSYEGKLKLAYQQAGTENQRPIAKTVPVPPKPLGNTVDKRPERPQCEQKEQQLQEGQRKATEESLKLMCEQLAAENRALKEQNEKLQAGLTDKTTSLLQSQQRSRELRQVLEAECKAAAECNTQLREDMTRMSAASTAEIMRLQNAQTQYQGEIFTLKLALDQKQAQAQDEVYLAGGIGVSPPVAGGITGKRLP